MSWSVFKTAIPKQSGTLNTPTAKPFATIPSKSLAIDLLPTPPKAPMRTTPFLEPTIPNLNLPGGVLEDYTDKGVMWDPVLSASFYKFDAGNNAFSAYDGQAPTAWLNFKGRWGDEEYPESDKRQVKLFGQAKFTGGPTGPVDKQLNREKICPDNGQLCILRSILVPRRTGMDSIVRDRDEVVG